MRLIPPFLLLLAACTTQDTNVKPYTEAPVVSITSPADGTMFGENAELTFLAEVSDDDDALEDLVYAWTKQDGAALIGTLEILDGEVRYTVPDGLGDGEYEIELKVSDTTYLDAADTVAISVVDNSPPTLAFLEPLDGATFGDVDRIDVDLLVGDAEEDDLNQVTLVWSGDLVDGAPANPTSDGHATYTIDAVEPGTYTIGVLATDSIGSTASASIDIEVVAVDFDGDGYAGTDFGGDDCDDDDASIHPGADEVCDSVDQDCDGQADEDAVDAPVRYLDADGDGYGNPDSSGVSCEDPGGYVTNADDCDDGDADIHPGADEVCDGVDQDCDGAADEDAIDEPTWYADLDGDGFGDVANTTAACDVPGGYTDDTTDCDDADADVSPDGVEVCNLVDDDCDGTVDEDADGAPTWHADLDGDSYGDPTVTMAACAQPGGFVADDQDCDDTDPITHPLAAEVCDGRDNDCDGTIDEGTDASDARTWYLDADGDDHGIPTTTTSSCAEPEGYSAVADDCDDTDAAVFPGAEEVCNVVDDDCDGTVDVGAVDATAWFPDADEDGYGDAASSVDACDAPAGFVENSADCDDAAAAVNPAAAEVCNGEDDDCDGTVDVGAVDASTWYADVDHDTYGDPAVSATACERPTDYVPDDQDCDDGSMYVNIDAVEVCDGIDNNCDGAVDEATASDALTWYADGDGDTFGDATVVTEACTEPEGYAASADDCDDTDASIFPGAEERCDGLDNNCDSVVDEATAVDAIEWYEDKDSDDYGSNLAHTHQCDAPPGYVDNNDDCNDLDDTMHPGGTEVCNGEDDDCDGADDEDAIDAATWYADTDGDSYGTAATTTAACSAPTGYVANDDDCNDGDAGISPADAEVCDTKDNNCDGTVDEASATDAPTWYADTDGDSYGNASSTSRACTKPSGFVSNDDDCNDGSSVINPAATEVCDALDVDEDCDGKADDADSPVSGTSTFYADTDGDTYGNATSTRAACSTPSGYVTNDDDCNDANAAISPLATEVCDSLDNDCDSYVDEADSSLVGATTWYADADHDSYGSAASTVTACTMPSGYVSTATDCDDTAGGVNPGATETCTTTGDDDCDGVTNEVGATSCTYFYVDGDGDSYGGTTSVCQCAASGSTTATAGGDCDDTDADEHPGATELCENGVDEDCDGLDAYCPIDGSIDASEFDVKYTGAAAGNALGYDLAFVPDVDGDGVDDVVLGAAAMSSYTGAAFLMFGGDTGTISVSTATTWITGTAASDYLGIGLAGGDFDGDGVGDLLMGAYGADEGGSGSGGAWVALGAPHTGVWVVNSYDDYGWFGSTTTDYFGYDVAAIPDTNGDGADEVAIGAYLQDSGGGSAGAVYLQFGPIVTASAHRSSATMDVKIIGEDAADELGTSVAAAGDFDGDGADDLAMTAFGDDTVAAGAGAFYVATNLDSLGSTVDASALDYKFAGDSSGDAWGYSTNTHPLSTAGDTNNDGYDDMIIGCYADDEAASNAGAAYVVFGGGDAGTQAMSVVGAKLLGDGSGDNFGFSVTGGDDLDGDGFDDVVVGGPYDDDGATNAGAAYVYYGTSAGSWPDVDAKIYGEDTSDYFGYTVQMGGDLNDDGFGDLLVGATADDDAGTTSGSVYAFFGAAR